MEITAQTALCGILLHPAGHTRSPAMHNAAYTALGIPAAYHAFDVRPEDLGAAVNGLRALGARQLSVSLPHKVEVIALLDVVDDDARKIGAVNTIVRRGDAFHGSNTDWIGAVRALERETPLDGARSVVLGAGGTARALAHGLLTRGAQVTVLNRTAAKARTLATELGAHAGGSLSELASTPHDVLVNTTSVGLAGDESPVEASAIAPDSVVMDVVYEPPQTRLLRDAEARGARTVTGKWMLVYQAVAQLAAWADAWDASTEAKATEIMSEAFDAAGEPE